MRRALPLLLLFLLAACAPDAPDEQALDEPEDTLPAPPFNLETLPPDSLSTDGGTDSPPPRPEVRVDTIHIEGTAQPERVALVRSPPAFRPPFSTYVPAGLRTEFMAGDSTPSVRFLAEFGGQLNPEAYLQVRIYPPGAAELVARNAVDAYLRGREPRQDNITESSRWTWAIDAYDFSYGGQARTTHFVGSIAIARHGNRYLHVLVHYPAEYGDGMGPRVEQILREWRWEDDGRMLISGR
ncbi:MAG TPA: hypothetical protein VK939_07140 [Longimicrobiales bacterium]|nr:hypothetical protein [Longimicrobiales bacterium]